MHYAHLRLDTLLVTIDKTPYVKNCLLLAKSEDRTFLISKIEQLTNPDNTMPHTTVYELFDRLDKVGLIPEHKHTWSALVSHRMAILNSLQCDCDHCYSYLKESLT